MARGGYQRPSNPAPVSGPGALSRRTDGGPDGQPVRVPTGGTYGQATELEQLQQAAPLSASPGAGDPGAADLTAGLIPFGAASQEPDVPITSGAALGEGPGPEALGLPSPEGEDVKRLQAYLPVFEHMANQPGSSRASRNVLRQLKGML